MPQDVEFAIDLDRLRPTQAAVGMRAVETKRRKVERRAERRAKLKRYLAKRPIPSVRGPGDTLYIIDRHHLSLALWHAEITSARVQIIHDFSDLPRRSFFARMERLGFLHPFDERGDRIAPAELPVRLDQLRADPYRDLAWSVREAGGFVKSQRPFAEFHWAAFFRPRIARSLLRDDYDRAVRKALRLARTPAADGLPGWLGVARE
jgi:hypothetical protein